MRNGFAIWAALAAIFILSASTALLISQASTSEMISHNQRLHTRAKMAAQSGLNHFRSLGLHYNDVVEQSGEEEQFLLIEDDTMPATRYRVFVTVGEDEGTFYVNSIGEYVSSGQVRASSQLAAQFITMEEFRVSP